MFDFYVACVRHFSVQKNCYYWKPLKIYTSRSSCLRFFKSYKLKSFDSDVYGILHIYQSQIETVNIEVAEC